MEEMYALARCRQWYSAHCATSLAALARSAECSAQQTNDHAANKWMRVIMPYNRSAVRVLVAARAWGVLESRRILARVQAKPSTGIIFGALQASCNFNGARARSAIDGWWHYQYGFHPLLGLLRLHRIIAPSWRQTSWRAPPKARPRAGGYDAAQQPSTPANQAHSTHLLQPSAAAHAAFIVTVCVTGPAIAIGVVAGHVRTCALHLRVTTH